ncbi:Retrovirus-related Pol polyprotein from transposon TNT 1-94 [Dendrobium catenatum]|uniref:Retrovirus-related Pol polyprotein from transposon TNT 1-94 n=1 Tax=Dendrobium catenatum TaxID=906689 RepID=A0A2I0VS49_9ASPA|nr:Retrovirus-related Pol polyprotein from transposon TNT 1-94 [Dendrobium catenatum]
MLHTASMPITYWPDAVATTVYLINRMPTPTTNHVALVQLMFHTKPDYLHLRTFGCECFPLIPSHSHNKLQPNSTSCTFLGYTDNYKGYQCLNNINKSIIVSRNVKFVETSFPFKNQTQTLQTTSSALPTSMLLPVLAPVQTHGITGSHTPPSNISRSPTTAPIQQPTDSAPISVSSPPQIPARHHMTTRSQTGNLKPVARLNLLHNESTYSEPTSYTEANKSFEWRQAMAAEFFALQKQGTWTLVPPPTNSTVLGCKWTYRRKLHSDGSVARFKARLVALGNQQEHGYDYVETFSPVAKLPTIRVLFTLALHHGWKIHQLDIENAFLHGTLDDTIYMRQPKGFEDSLHPHHVCLLRKSIYGLRQAPRQWYNTFSAYLATIGFRHSKSDPSLLTYRKGNVHIMLLVYVDDILITGNNEGAISDTLTKLHNAFSLKHLGHANHFLGIKIQHNTYTYFLSQQSYANSIIQQSNLIKCNPVANPSSTKLRPIHRPICIGPILHCTDNSQELFNTLQSLVRTSHMLSTTSLNICTIHYQFIFSCSNC